MPELLTAIQVAGRIGVSTRTLHRLVAAGKFPSPARVNRKIVRWHSEVVKAWIDQLCGHPDRSAV